MKKLYTLSFANLISRYLSMMVIIILFLTFQILAQNISTGPNEHTVVTKADGTVFSWGWNLSGQLGNGNNTNSNVPVRVITTGVLSSKTITSVAAGLYHSIALASDGTVYTWGRNNYGQLGSGNNTDSNTPVAVSTTGVLSGKTIIAIAAGYEHSIALASDGTVYTWGRNIYGALGNGNYTDSNVPVAVVTSGVLFGKTITNIAAGGYYSIALASDGTVYTWGDNIIGQLGNGNYTYSNVPVAVVTSGVLSGKTINAVAAGYEHSIVLASDGTVYTWGYNGFGELGNGNITDSNVPVAVVTTEVLSGKTITAVAAGGTHSIALSSDGTVYTWGNNSDGQLGNGNNTNSHIPVAIITSDALCDKTIISIAAGSSHSIVLASDGTVFSWGRNYLGQLGNGNNIDSNVPVAVDQSSMGLLTGQDEPFAGGDGSEENPYLVATADQLNNVRNYLSSYFKQIADIDLNSYSTGAGWIPIPDFSGHYDGGGHLISNLTINRSNEDGIGLFKMFLGSIKDLGLIDVIITGRKWVGALCGTANSSNLERCFSTGSVSGKEYFVGGLVGEGGAFNIEDCYSLVDVSTVSTQAGGLVGYSYGNAIINDSYSSGKVRGNYSGGLISTADDCTITNSFWDKESSGFESSAGGMGKSTSEMKTQSTFLNAGWDPSIWYMDAEINNGYPYLSWQNTTGTPLPVELSSFTANVVNRNIVLTWQTSTENNNRGFEIERKLSHGLKNLKWKKIGFVQGKGSSNSPEKYSFTDTKLFGSSRFTYRIRQIDYGGKFTYSKIIEVEVVPDKYELFQNYPNPFNPSTTINYSIKEKVDVKITVINTIGQEVAILLNEQKEPGRYQLNFNASSLPSGAYFCRMQAGSFVSVKKMLLMK